MTHNECHEELDSRLDSRFVQCLLITKLDPVFVTSLVTNPKFLLICPKSNPSTVVEHKLNLLFNQNMLAIVEMIREWYLERQSADEIADRLLLISQKYVSRVDEEVIEAEMKAIRDIVLTRIEKKDWVLKRLTANEYFDLYGDRIIKDHYRDVGFMEKKDELIAFLIDNCNKFVNDTYEKNKKYDPIVTFGGALFVFCVPALIIWGIIAAVYGATR